MNDLPAVRHKTRMDPKISKPCPASWEAMTGDQKSRHCDKCNKSVHNISELSAKEAESLLCQTANSVCIRIQQSKDGSFKTKSGWMKRVAMVGAAGLTLIPMSGCDTQQSVMGKEVNPEYSQPTTGSPTSYSVGESIQPEPEPLTGDIAVEPNPETGEIVCPPKIIPEEPNQTLGRIAIPQPETN